MPGLNLTRDEAIERAGIIKRVHTYRVDPVSYTHL